MSRIVAIDRMRGLCAVLVVLIHAPPLLHSSIPALRISGWGILELCQIAVPYFFLLSGWMAGEKWRSGKDSFGDLAGGLIRLLWLYVPWFLLYLAIDALSGLSTDPWIVVRRFLGVSDGRVETMGYHLWFLPSLLFAQILSWSSFRLARSAVPAMAIGAALYLGLALHEATGGRLPWGLVPNEGPNIALLCFALGAILPGFAGRMSPRSWLVASAAAFPFLWIEPILRNQASGADWAVPYFTAARVAVPATILVWLVVRSGSGRPGPASLILDRLGRDSTAIYLAHLAILVLVPFESIVSNGFLRDNLVRWPVAILGSMALAMAVRALPWPRIRALVS